MLRSSFSVSAAALTTVMVLAAPAAADDGEPPVFPQMTISIRYPTASTHEVCWSARNRGITPPTLSAYRLTIVGARAAGVPILHGPFSTSGTTASGCDTVYKDGATAGDYYVIFTYDAVGGADIPSVLVATGLWTGAQNNKVEASQ